MRSQEKLRVAGARLANCAYNLAQCARLNGDERRSLDEARRDWDAAIAAQPAAAQEAVAIDADAYHAMNGELCDFAIRWRLDGDYLRCTGCNRPQLTNYAGEAFAHAGGCKRADTTETHPWLALRRIMRPMFAPVTAAPAEMSPEFTDTARAAIAWVLYHHQGGNSPVGQPLRCALGMDSHEPLPEWRIAEAKRYAEWAGATTAEFHQRRASTPAAPGIDLADEHKGMRVDYHGLLRQVQKGLAGEPGLAEMVRQLHNHMTELGRRWYAGDRRVVDELLQLYCIESDARRALIDASPKGALNEQFGSAEGLGGPKGGSAARLRTMVVTLAPLWRMSDSWLEASDSPSDKHRAMWGCAKELRDKLVQMQTQAGDAEVQPLCDLCRKRPEAHSDAEGIGFCEVCWGEWVEANSHGAGDQA